MTEAPIYLGLTLAQVGEAIGLIQIDERFPEKSLGEYILLMARLNHLAREIDNKLISEEEANVQKNRIAEALIYFAEKDTGFKNIFVEYNIRPAVRD